MVHAPAVLGAGLLVLVAFAAGAVFHLWWERRLARSRRRIPKHWPLETRRIVSTNEAKAWRALVKAFPEYHVMVKLPITRFTTPRASENKLHLFELLSRVYCTFTVCASNGEVIGCVDVQGDGKISRSNQLLKLALLSQCGICYWIVEPDAVPSVAAIREYFLGETPLESQGQGRQAIASAQVQLRALVERQRHKRNEQAGRTPNEYALTGWQQPDSFIAPLDSRLAGLH